MMKILEINSVCGTGSTGRIAVDIAEAAKRKDAEVCVAFGRGTTSYDKSFDFSSGFESKIHGAMTRAFDAHGCFSKLATNRLLCFMDNYKPDIVHLHNIHGYYLNYELLFNYLKINDINIIWTLHDCWAFTGHCVYFDVPDCNLWKNECYSPCPMKKEYPTSIFLDRSKQNFRCKRDVFTSIDVNKLTIVTPSAWLCDIVGESFLKKYQRYVIHNGIDLDVFKPDDNNTFRKDNGLNDEIVLLGVADGLDDLKGLNEYIALSKRLSTDYKIVLVGCEEDISNEASNILTIKRTKDRQELISIYSAANAFLNLTLSDNFPTVNLEALACGLPIITYKTGGSAECLSEGCGIAISQHDIDDVLDALQLLKNQRFDKEKCLKRAQDFDRNTAFDKYIELFMKSSMK